MRLSFSLPIRNARPTLRLLAIAIALSAILLPAAVLAGSAVDGAPIQDRRILKSICKQGRCIWDDMEFADPRRRREAAFEPNSKWPNGNIYFRFDSDISAEHQKLFKRAASKWQAAADVCFLPASGRGPSIRVMNAPVNFSSLGQTAIGMERENARFLIRDWSEKTVLHELGHTLGLIHEQSRSDREQWINVGNNIIDGKKGNFIVSQGSINLTEYDYCSIMHYGATFFSSNRQPVLTVVNGAEPFCRIGAAKDLSELDKAGVSARYGSPKGRCSQRD